MSIHKSSTGVKISNKEIDKIISEESAKFISRVSKEKLGRFVVDMSISAASQIDDSISNESIRSSLLKTFINEDLKFDTTTGNLATEVYDIIKKYTEDEAYYRSNDLKHQLISLTGEELFDRVETIKTIERAFESSEFAIPLSEDLKDELDTYMATEGASIISDVVKEVTDSMKDANEKAEVTRSVVASLKETKDKIKSEQDAMNPSNDNDTGEEGLKLFDSTAYLKEKIPVTVGRFELMEENFNEDYFLDVLVTLDSKSSESLEDNVKYLNSRFGAVSSIDSKNVKEFDTERVEKVKDMFNSALGTLKSYKADSIKLGIDLINGDTLKPVDKRLLQVITEIKAYAEESDKLSYINNIINKSNEDIVSEENLISKMVDRFILVSNSSKDFVKNLDHSKYTQAIEDVNASITEYIVDNKDKLSNFNNVSDISVGLAGLSMNKLSGEIDEISMNKLYYTAIKKIDPTNLTSFETSMQQIKANVAAIYGSEKYDGLIENIFNESNVTNIDTENLYEASIAGIGKKFVTESNEFPDELHSDTIKKMAIASTAFVKTSNKLNFMTKLDVRKYADELVH